MGQQMQIMSKFRHFHLLHILTQFQDQHLPIDVFLKKYLKNNTSIGSHDRKYLAESVYTFIRWKGLLFSLYGTLPLQDLIPLLDQFNPEDHQNKKDLSLHDQLSFPENYITYLIQELGIEKTKEFCLASNTQAPTTLRTNALKTSRDELFDLLKKNHQVTLGQHSSLAIHFEKKTNFLVLPEFKEGLFEVQDEGSQLLALQVQLKPGDHFLDFCAGSGGKTLAIAPQTQGKGQIYLHDIRPRALLEAKKRLQRAGIQNAQIAAPDSPSLKTLKHRMDWILVDAPCSGSGTLRRNPDMKWRFSLEELEETIALQKTIFSNALNFLKPGGYIVYATCSVFPRENDLQIQYFLQNFPLTLVGSPFSSFPKIGGMDGFYAAVLQKC